MKFLQNWLSTNTVPSPLRLLDFAYLVVILPLLSIIKLPMLLFLLLSSILIIKEKKPTNLTQILVGIFALLSLFFSLYGSFNFAGISRLKLFIELLIYILFIAISMQRLTGVINIYLKLSPLFLLALSLFFFHSVSMLFYVVIEIFILTLLILWQIMQSNFSRVFRVSSLLFLTALPWVILLFIFFPRISFEHANYGFKGESVKRMGHDGKMYLDNTALLVPSERIVMEVGFKEKVPKPDMLYFRGSVLYEDKNNHWEPLVLNNAPRQIDFNTTINPLSYKVTLYPTNKHWLYLLDMPITAPKNAQINTDLETTAIENVTKILHYNATSILSSQIKQPISKPTRRASLTYNTKANPKSQHLAKQIREAFTLPSQRLLAIEKLFKTQDLTYSLSPKPLDLNHSTDSFLWESKEGYCVHFAAAFTTMARMVEIPARIVTGYKSNGEKSVKNYLVVREKDAHAWVEVYMNHQWNRVETTAFASHVKLNGETKEAQGALSYQLSQLNLTLLYVKYQIETWILEYNYLRQMKLFDTLKTDVGFLLKFVLLLLFIIIASSFAWKVLREQVCEDRLLCMIYPVLKKVEKLHYHREDKESLQQFFHRIESDSRLFQLKSLNQLYHKLRYAPHPTKEEYKAFERVAKLFLKSF